MTSDDAESKKDATPAEKPESAAPETTADETVKLGKAESETPKAAETAATAAAAPAEPAASSGGKRPVGWLVAAGTGVVAVGAITAAVVFFLQSNDRGDKLDAIEESTKAACAYGRVATNYDYSNNIDKYFEDMRSGSTGDINQQFTEAGDLLKDMMVERKVKSRGEDIQCAYLSGGEDQAKAMVTLAQYSSNITGVEEPPMNIAIEMTLDREGDKWLVSKMESPVLKNGGGLMGGVPGGAPQQPAPETPAPAPAPGN
ncbi:hypothetical protein [Nocardia rosealba]|uniref:hypothetical protein n=1 Tax=Nocardia rosealba TaxID=2878563 RepID=UPI001CDA0134|nr:hypothetical protein [Nocardia rosealba]MCA2209806.1 hypothetical protein [Nocardia rosealba]